MGPAAGMGTGSLSPALAAPGISRAGGGVPSGNSLCQVLQAGAKLHEAAWGVGALHRGRVASVSGQPAARRLEVQGQGRVLPPARTDKGSCLGLPDESPWEHK